MLTQSLKASLPELPDSHQRSQLNIGLMLIFGLYLAVSAVSFGFVPIWDAWEYTDLCVLKAAESLNPLDFNCFSHPSMAFMGLVGWTQIISYGNVYLLHGAVALLSLLSIYAFYKIGAFLFPDSERTLSLYLITFCYAFLPVILGSAFNLNADQGMMIFLILYVASLLYQKNLLVVLASTGLLFTKEPALLLYPLILVCYFALFIYQHPTTSTKLFRLINRHVYLLTPIMFFAVYGLLRVIVMHQPLLWLNVGMSGSGAAGLNIIPISDLFNPAFHAQLALIFLIHFNWLMTLIIGLSLLTWFVRWLNRQPRMTIEWNNSAVRAALFIVLVFLGTLYVVTRFKSFATPRYFVTIYPLLLLVFFIAYQTLPINQRIRNGSLVIFSILLFWSNFATIDPLSKIVYGTFNFGTHEMLKMTSLTGECCGYGQDQLVYNLEFMRLQALQNNLFADLRPTFQTTLASNSRIDGFDFTDNFFTLVGQLDNQTFHQTAGKDATVYKYTHAEDLANLAIKPKDVYFVEYPMYSAQTEFNRFLQYYKVVETKKFDQDGYSINLYHLLLQL